MDPEMYLILTKCTLRTSITTPLQTGVLIHNLLSTKLFIWFWLAFYRCFRYETKLVAFDCHVDEYLLLEKKNQLKVHENTDLYRQV